MKILYYSGWTLTRIISKLFFRIKIYGKENIPTKGGFILASNHISFYDPPLVGSWIGRQVYFLAKQELFRNKIFGGIISRTNALPLRRGAIDRGVIEKAVDVISNNFGMTIFPEGTRSLSDDFLPPKAGVGMLAIQAKCPVIPVYIHGSNKLKDCFWGKERMSITYGESIPAEYFEKFATEKDSYVTIAQYVMDKILELKHQRLTKSK